MIFSDCMIFFGWAKDCRLKFFQFSHKKSANATYTSINICTNTSIRNNRSDGSLWKIRRFYLRRRWKNRNNKLKTISRSVQTFLLYLIFFPLIFRNRSHTADLIPGEKRLYIRGENLFCSSIAFSGGLCSEIITIEFIMRFDNGVCVYINKNRRRRYKFTSAKSVKRTLSVFIQNAYCIRMNGTERRFEWI